MMIDLIPFYYCNEIILLHAVVISYVYLNGALGKSLLLFKIIILSDIIIK